MTVPLLPELTLEVAAGGVGLYDATGGYRSHTPPPFWSFAWPGGIALARFVLDHPAYVAGRTVLDLGAGGGLVGIAAAKAGAARVTAVDTDPAALAAARRNAARNGVTLDTATTDTTTTSTSTTSTITASTTTTGTVEGPADVVLAGDVFYTATVTAATVAFLRTTGATVLVGDPGRGYLPDRLFEPLAAYEVPVRRELEGTDVLRTTVYRMRVTSS